MSPVPGYTLEYPGVCLVPLSLWESLGHPLHIPCPIRDPFGHPLHIPCPWLYTLEYPGVCLVPLSLWESLGHPGVDPILNCLDICI